jgi:hypothetical protein
MRTRLCLLAAALTLLVAPGLASAQELSEAGVAALVRQEVDAQNRHDLAATLALLTDDFVQEGGTCMDLPGGRCVGKAAYAEQAAHDEGHIRSTLNVLNVQVLRNTATVRAENRFTPNLPPLQAAGIERLVEIGRAELRGGKLASLRIVPDVSDPQTARASAGPGAPGIPRARDGQTLATQSAATRAAFVAVFGVDSLGRWVQEHEAELARAGH